MTWLALAMKASNAEIALHGAEQAALGAGIDPDEAAAPYRRTYQEALEQIRAAAVVELASLGVCVGPDVVVEADEEESAV